ncbi:MAG: MOSC domain-containing protein [Myxococcota bacterium]
MQNHPPPRSAAELSAGLAEIAASPRDRGLVRMIVRRPQVETRETLTDAELSVTEGLVGDSWRERVLQKSPSGVADPETQLTLMNARAAQLVAQAEQRWPLAGDQLYVDLDLSGENLPTGTRLSVGGALLEITAKPHTGCKKFVERFGMDAMLFVNSPEGRRLNLRGIYARVLQAGRVRVGDRVEKTPTR